MFSSFLLVTSDHLPHLEVRRQQRAEAQQRQVGHRVALLPLRPVLPEASGGRRRRGGQVAVVVVVVVDGFGKRAAAVAPDQKLPPVAAVVQQPGRHQQHQDEEAEQEEEHVDHFGLRGQVGAATCKQEVSSWSTSGRLPEAGHLTCTLVQTDGSSRPLARLVLEARLAAARVRPELVQAVGVYVTENQLSHTLVHIWNTRLTVYTSSPSRA